MSKKTITYKTQQAQISGFRWDSLYNYVQFDLPFCFYIRGISFNESSQIKRHTNFTLPQKWRDLIYFVTSPITYDRFYSQHKNRFLYMLTWIPLDCSSQLLKAVRYRALFSNTVLSPQAFWVYQATYESKGFGFFCRPAVFVWCTDIRSYVYTTYVYTYVLWWSYWRTLVCEALISLFIFEEQTLMWKTLRIQPRLYLELLGQSARNWKDS